MGIMSGSRPKEGEHREVIFRVGSCEGIEIIAEVIAVSMGIPVDITIRLAVGPVAFTVTDSVLQAVAGAFFTLPCCSIDRNAIDRK